MSRIDRYRGRGIEWVPSCFVVKKNSLSQLGNYQRSVLNCTALHCTKQQGIASQFKRQAKTGCWKPISEPTRPTRVCCCCCCCYRRRSKWASEREHVACSIISMAKQGKRQGACYRKFWIKKNFSYPPANTRQSRHTHAHNKELLQIK